MKSHQTLDSLWFPIALAYGLYASPLIAQPRPHVAMKCQIEAVALRAYWGRETNRIGAELCSRLIEHLHVDPQFSFWDFKAGIKEKAAHLLDLRVIDGIAEEEDQLQLTFKHPRKVLFSHRDVWRRPGAKGLRKDPPADRAVDVLFDAFDRAFEKHKPDLLDLFKRMVPIAKGGRLLPKRGAEPTSVVSWLPWQRYGSLRKSKFQVVCDSPSRKELAYLQSIGHSTPYRYQSEEDVLRLVVESCIYEGDKSEPEPSQISQDELGRLEPRLVYLKEYIEPDLEIYPFE